MCECCEGNSDVMCFHFISIRQYMNRKGGFNRPLDFIAWWCELLVETPDNFTFVLILAVDDDAFAF